MRSGSCPRTSSDGAARIWRTWIGSSGLRSSSTGWFAKTRELGPLTLELALHNLGDRCRGCDEAAAGRRHQPGAL